jgi:MraZ protein
MPVIFTGTSDHTIDSKLRLSVPAKHRGQLEGTPEGKFWCAVPWGIGVIRLYPKASYEELSAKGMKWLLPDQDSSELTVGFHGLTETLEVDTQGRIGLPRRTLEDAGLVGTTEVVIVGCGGWLEIRDRAVWEAGRRARVADLPKLVSKIYTREGSPNP